MQIIYRNKESFVDLFCLAVDISKWHGRRFASKSCMLRVVFETGFGLAAKLIKSDMP